MIVKAKLPKSQVDELLMYKYECQDAGAVARAIHVNHCANISVC
jgi:hypothetical protein